MTSITIVFPHQLFANSPAIAPGREVVVVEEHLFFCHYRFHKRKLAYHRATVAHYVERLRKQGLTVHHLETGTEGTADSVPAVGSSGGKRKESLPADVRKLAPWLKRLGVRTIHVCDPHDDWLSRRLSKLAEECGGNIIDYESPQFLTSRAEIDTYFDGKRRLFQTDFYVHQRKRLNLLVDEHGKPLGGKWSFDADNRQRYPKGKQPPTVRFPRKNRFQQEASGFVQSHFAQNYGQLDDEFRLPISHEESSRWLDQFFELRFAEFGAYEDAIQLNELVLHHSLLTPMMNVGLILPSEVIARAVAYADEYDVPLNSLEGFLRQVVGWREFIRAVYHLKGVEQRTRNYWEFDRKIPACFWQGTTGIAPLDAVVSKVNRTAYCHHIERLMVLGNFMLLCEFDPDEVYRWFMEMFIDAYDWVMVPNVYGMSQFADGGLMSTKPYISGSNYLLKMSDAGKGSWQQVWDGLFWRFMDRHRDFFSQNPRMGVLVRNYDSMAADRRKTLSKCAEDFLSQLQ